MTKTSKPILFFGTEDFSAYFLQVLLDEKYDIRAVITKPDSKKGRGHALSEPIVKTIAKEHSIPVWQPVNLMDIADAISSFENVAGVLVSYGKIIPESVIELFSPGIINVHPSLLPKYRGPSPIESAILSGGDKTGISIMQLSPLMDAGPVYSQVEVELNHTETKPQLYRQLATIGAKELVRMLPSVFDGSLQPTAQNEPEATYCKLLTKADSTLDPSKLTAEEAERRVRAFLGFPKSKLHVGEQQVIVTRAHVSNEQKTPLDVMFADGKFLSIDELVAPSGKTMNAEAFLRGY